MNASSKCASWASSPIDRPRFRWTSPRSGSSRPAASRSSVVLPAPLGPTRPIRSPTAIAASIESRIDERADLAGHPRQPQDAHRSASAGVAADGATVRGASGTDRRPRRGPAGGRRALRPLGPARAPQRARPRPASARRSPPPPARSTGRPSAGARRSCGARIAGAPFRSAARQPLAPRAEVRRPAPDHDAPDRSSAPWARLAGSLVDREPFLHRAIAVGRGVVVDRAAPSGDRLGEDRPDRLVQPPLVRPAERAGGSQRVQARRPQRLVGVDVARLPR